MIENRGKARVEVTSRMPTSVVFLLASILLERYASGSIASTMSLFFHRKLGFDSSLSTALFHTYELAVYSFTIIGAIIADNWLGLYKTVVSFSFIYSAGALLTAIGAIGSMPIEIFTLIGLITAMVGCGCMKSNSNTFAANQYKLPEQASQMSFYFSIQYFCMKSGSTFGRFFNPMLRQDVKCFGMNDCYPAAFGVPSMAMMLSLMLVICGRRFHTHKPPTGNMFVRVCACIMNGVGEKIKKQKTDPKDHWLDYAEDKHGAKLVMETKMVLNALVLFLPIPIFWTLQMQQGSRWVFQATRMNGDLGFYTLKPDQMIVFNSIFSIIMVPIYDRMLYPLLARVGFKTPLQKIAVGLFMAAASFVLAALIEMKIETGFIHILWLIPQYFVMVLGEIMVLIPNYNFAYSEAPASMKSVMVAFVYLTMAGGNLFMIFISGTRLFASQVNEFLFFAGVMLVAMAIFIVLAVRYKYVTTRSSDDSDEKA